MNTKIKIILKCIIFGCLGFGFAYIVLGYLIPSIITGIVSAGVTAWWQNKKEQNDES
jgi:hypothetical protein